MRVNLHKGRNSNILQSSQTIPFRFNNTTFPMSNTLHLTVDLFPHLLLKLIFNKKINTNWIRNEIEAKLTKLECKKAIITTLVCFYRFGWTQTNEFNCFLKFIRLFAVYLLRNWGISFEELFVVYWVNCNKYGEKRFNRNIYGVLSV